jgi:CBS domain-containing protein
MFRAKAKGLILERFTDIEKPVTEIASKEVVSCRQNETIGKLVDLLLGGYRKFPVTAGGRLIGVVGITDVINFLGAGQKHRHFLQKKNPFSAKIANIMEKDVKFLDHKAKIGNALEQMKEHRKGACPIVKDGELVGWVSEWDFLKLLKGNIGIQVEELMREKPFRIRESYPVSDVANIIVRGGYRRLPVTRGGILTGILTPYDVLSYLNVNQKLDAMRTEKYSIEGIMKKSISTIEMHKDVSEAVEIMKRNRLGGLPVTDEEELVGIITESDVVNALV